MEGRKIHAVDANLAAVYTLSKLNILIASFVLSLVAFPPVFMLSVFNPCWNCQCTRSDTS
ncbi:hypothetical protein T492DRAFT_866768 [Pavlovales sp. CCMP2436]|nr:hypothetical protein T492DRAFT_866768 [Pavlovales sp. CCMP2436]